MGAFSDSEIFSTDERDHSLLPDNRLHLEQYTGCKLRDELSTSLFDDVSPIWTTHFVDSFARTTIAASTPKPCLAGRQRAGVARHNRDV